MFHHQTGTIQHGIGVLGVCSGVLLWLGWLVGVKVVVGVWGQRVPMPLLVWGQRVPSPLHPCFPGCGVPAVASQAPSPTLFAGSVDPLATALTLCGPRSPVWCGSLVCLVVGPLIVLYSSSTLRILDGNQVLQSYGSGHGEAVSLHRIEDLFTVNNPPVLRLGALGIVGLL